MKESGFSKIDSRHTFKSRYLYIYVTNGSLRGFALSDIKINKIAFVLTL